MHRSSSLRQDLEVKNIKNIITDCYCNMEEIDIRKKAKRNAEFITPNQLRIFLSKKVMGENLTVLEPAIGSGQLIFNILDKCKYIHGFDINIESVNASIDNLKGIDTFIENTDFITCNTWLNYDIAISNYPFSLIPNEEQKKYILNDPFLSSFYDGKVTGKLDIIFILKSFHISSEGIYLCFPGIGYRGTERYFREYLVNNKFIKEYGLIENCKFEHTNIPILFLHLTKTPNDKTKSFYLDLKTNEIIEEEVKEWDDQFTFYIPRKEQDKEVINTVELENSNREKAMKVFITQIKFSKLVYEVDESIQLNCIPVKSWVDNCINEFKKSI